MTTAQHWQAPPTAGRGFASTSPASTSPASTKAEAGTDVASLYAGLALLGIAALAGAAASSLIPGLWMAGIVSAAYSLATLAYAFLSLRKGFLPKESVLLLVLGSAALLHLAGLLQGLWRMPEAGRTFDVTLASLLVLELSVVAVVGWRRNAVLRRQPGRGSQREPSAVLIVGAIFAASILVAAITTVGMAASTAGDLAVPHSGHGGSHDAPVVPGNIQQLKEQGHHH